MTLVVTLVWREGEEDGDMCTNHVTVSLTDVPCDTVAGVTSFCFSGEEGGGSEVCSGVGCGSIVSAAYETRRYS